MILRDSHVLLTGASKGLGAALAREYAKRGARVTLLARPSPELDAVAAQTGAVALPVDLSDFDGLNDTVARAEERNGPLDALVNNAALVRLGPFSGMSNDDMRAQLFTNLLAPMELTRQALPGMLDRDHGTIVNVASLSANVSIPNASCYSVSKTGLSKFTVDLQTELKDSKVRAVLVTLGAVGGTPMIRQFEQDPRTAGIVGRFKTFTTPAERVAERVADAVESDKQAVLVVPRIASPLVSYNLLPMRLIGRAVAR